MKILFVSQYADPSPIGGNNNVFRQARTLKNDLGVEVEILTWPEGDLWSGPLPVDNENGEIAQFSWSYEGLKFHVVRLPVKLVERTLKDADWRCAVDIGCELLRKIKPSIVHLQHWRGLWWILESANRLSIPTVYTSHDWGLGCLRTILVKGEGGLCDGVIKLVKCAKCIWSGRNILGKVNETLVSSPIGERIIEKIDHSIVERWLTKHGAVRIGLSKRVNLNYMRAKNAIESLSGLIVPSQFAKNFFLQFGIDQARIHVEPWYYDLTVTPDVDRINQERIVLGYVGRISPEKGVERIFDALLSDSLERPMHFVVAGAIDSKYAEHLYSRFTNTVGKHSVEWMGWIAHNDIHKFFNKVDAVIIPSEWMDNTPLTLIESFAFMKPVIISDIPSVSDMVQDGVTGYLTSFDSKESLEMTIQKVTMNPGELNTMRNNIPKVKSSVEYVTIIKDIYDTICMQYNRL